MKRHELLWMILPCIALALLAVALRGRPGANIPMGEEEFALVAEKIEREAPTPYQVWKGYDSRLKITFNHRGPKPAWWGKEPGGGGSSEGVRLVFEDSGALRPVKLPPDFKRPAKVFLWRPEWDSKTERYQARILTRLADVPPRPNGILAEANLFIDDGVKALSPSLRLSHPVRDAGEIIKAPSVSRDPGCKVERAGIYAYSLAERERGGWRGYKARITLLANKTIRAGEVNVNGATLRDEKGKKWGMCGWMSGSSDAYYVEDVRLNSRRFSMNIDCELEKIPLSAGRVWLEINVSLNEAWPLTARIPVRDERGKILFTPLTPVPFKVVSTRLRAATASEKQMHKADRVVEVIASYTGKSRINVLTLPWEYHKSQRIVDAGGKIHWVDTYSDPGPYVNARMNGIRFLFYLPIRQIPAKAGRLTFKAEIGLPGTRRVPISTVVRNK
jgi:hypothetical protein